MIDMKDTMLIFDLDGTLWDSGAQVAAAWNIVLKQRMPQKANLTAQVVKSVMGKTMDEIADALCPDVDEKLRKEIFAECYEYENEYITLHGGKLFEGVEETLKELIADGYKLAIVSNCQAGYINAFLVSMEMGEYFCDTEEWGRSGLLKADNIKLVMERNGFEKAVYIGDTAGDEASARRADIPFVYAAYGFGDASSPDAVLENFSRLPETVEKLLTK